MDLNARVDVNCGRKDGRTENRTPISHLAKAGATKTVRNSLRSFNLRNRRPYVGSVLTGRRRVGRMNTESLEHSSVVG